MSNEIKCSNCKKHKAVWFPPTNKETIELWNKLNYEAKPLCEKCHDILKKLILEDLGVN